MKSQPSWVAAVLKIKRKLIEKKGAASESYEHGCMLK